MIAVIAAWLGVCAIWMGLLVAQIRARRRGLFLEDQGRPAAQDRDAHRPSVCVVIPCRDESRRIVECLASVRSQDWPALDILVVDDRSDDDTGAIVERIAAQDSRVRLLRNDTLPAGWLGKSHALWQGTRTVTSDWILFLDADCTLEPCAVRVAMNEALRRDVDLLTLWPSNRAEGFWEHLLIPLCAGVVALWYGSGRVNVADDKLAFANGQFLLVRREAYERVGGHRSVRRAVIEDIPFAEHAKQRGVRCLVASGRDLFSVRMYSSYGAIRDGWARIYVGALRSGLKIAVSAAWLLFGSLWPCLTSPVLFVPAVSRIAFPGAEEATLWTLRLCCGLHLALILIVSFRFWGLGACRRRYLLLYPLSVILVLRILWRAWWWLAVRRSIRWSTTEYEIDGKGVIVG